MLDLHLRPSPTLGITLAAAHLLALLVVWLMPISLTAQLAFSPLLATSFLFHLKRDVLLAAPRSVVALRFSPDCRCICQTRCGAEFEATPLGSSLVTPWLCVLNLRPEQGRFSRHAVILPDSADAEGRRKLRVLLRWKCHGSGL